MTGTAFFEQLASESPNSSRSLYFGAPADVLPPALQAQLGSPADFFPSSSSNKTSEVNVWFGSDGITADTHYDSDDNFYVVLHGEKAFELWSPSRARALPVFPCLHAGYRQVQVCFYQNH